MGRRIIIVMLLLVSLTACGGSSGATTGTSFDQSSTEQESSTGGAPNALPAAASVPEAPAAAEDGQKLVDISGQQIQANQNAQAGSPRLVIRTATLRVLVQDVIAAEANVRALAESRGGFVLSSQASGQESNRTATVSFKVPAERFDESLNEVAKLAVRVDSQEVQGQDVTDEFVDLESRLRNLRLVEERLQQFLADANRTEDALAVNDQLTDIQGQIEQAQGRMSYLRQSAALSTITVTFYAEPVVAVLPVPGWTPGSTARAALKSLIGFGQGLADIVIVVAIWSPVWLPLLLGVLLVLRRTRRPAMPAPQPDSSSSQP